MQLTKYKLEDIVKESKIREFILGLSLT